MNIAVGQSLGHYHIMEKLGEGGMASVYKAFDTRLERDVAIKVIRVDQFAPATLSRILQRFEREAKALGRLTHPNIVHVNDYGEQEGIPFLVMDYLPSGTLKQLLGKPVPWSNVAKLLLPVARALQYAHEQGIIHRDIKPSNILVTRSGEPMLADFGIAKILETEETTSLTGTGASIGTPEYMAPEQWTGQISPRSDIYSLGVVFYEMITGHKPYTADTPAAILLKQATEPLPRPNRYIPDLPEAIEKVLIKALAKKAEDRYQTMAEFANAIEQLLSNQGFPTTSSQIFNRAETRTSTLTDSQKTSFQGTTMDTQPQGTAQAESRGGTTATDYSTKPSNATHPQPDHSKSKVWIWLGGLGGAGCLLLAGIIIIPLLLKGFKPTPTTAPVVNNNPSQPLPVATSVPTLAPPVSPLDAPTYTNAPTYTFLPTYTDAPTYTPVIPTNTEVVLPLPRMFDFQACLDSCNGSNGLNSFPEGTTKIYLQWRYENIPAGAHFVRISSLGGNEWANYDCTWPNPSSGTDYVTFTEPMGIRSGDWNLSIYINGQLLLSEIIRVEGNWNYWDPAGSFSTCYGKR